MSSFTVTRKNTYTVLWLHYPYTTYCEDYIRVRSGFRNKMDRCFKCKYEFQVGDQIGLGCIRNEGNKVFCKDCSKELEIITPVKAASVAEPQSSDHQTE
jgi:hypothetical protein